MADDEYRKRWRESFTDAEPTIERSRVDDSPYPEIDRILFLADAVEIHSLGTAEDLRTAARFAESRIRSLGADAERWRAIATHIGKQFIARDGQMILRVGDAEFPTGMRGGLTSDLLNAAFPVDAPDGGR